MAVLRIPTQLRNLSANEAEVKVEGATVAEVLQGLNTQHPGFGERLFDENGRTAPLRQRVRRRRGHPLPAEPRHARR